MQARGGLDRFIAVAGFAQDFDIGVVLEHAAESAPHQGMVVHQQYGDP
jgi:hypothetical protein